jgi:hypothetical protein
MNRFAAGAGSLAAAGAIAADVAASTDGGTAGLTAAIGVATLTLALAVQAKALVPVALVVLGAGYAVALAGRDDVVDGRALLLAPAFLLAAELAYWALEPRTIPVGRDVVTPRLAALAGLALGAMLMAAFLVGTAAIDVPGTAALVAVGVLAATGALALSAKLARRGA